MCNHTAFISLVRQLTIISAIFIEGKCKCKLCIMGVTRTTLPILLVIFQAQIKVQGSKQIDLCVLAET